MKARMTGILVLVLACTGPYPLAGHGGWGPSAALAQADDVTAAQTLYDQGKFAEAAAAIQEGLSSGRIIGGQVMSARELLARCQVKMGDVPGARRTFLSLMRQDPQYRPDALRVPPDEMDVYNLARREFDAEQQRAAQRIPASLEIHYGIGSGANEDFGEFVALGGGDEEYDNDPHVGGIVRFAVASRLSIDLQVERFRATNEDRTFGFTYEITALPVSVGLSYLLLDGERFRGYVFAGGGPLLEATSSLTLDLGFPLQVADDKVGTYLHGGIEGEYRVHPRFSVTGRVLGRYARATGLFEETDFDPYAPGVTIDDRDIDFSGFAATLGLRAYVGY